MARTLPRRAVAGLLAASLLLVVSAPAHAEVVSIRPEIQPFGSIGVYDGGLTPVQVSETFRSSAGTDPTPATIVSLTFTGPDAAAFSNVGTSCKPGNSVSGGCVMNLLFNPTHAGLHQATLTINHTGENGPITRSLTGTGLLDPPNIEGGPLDFGPVLTGTTKRSVVFLQRALKTAPLTIASMTIVGPNAAEFFFGERTADCEVGTVVSRHVEGGFGEPGERCFKEVVFNPATRGVKDASVRITFQGTDYVKTVPLVAEGLAEAQLGAPASVDFGALEVGRMTARPLVLTNVGDRPLTIGSLVFAGALDFFAAPDGCTGAALAPGSSCTVGERFNPLALGARSGSITVESNNRFGPRTIALTGTGGAQQPGPAGPPGPPGPIGPRGLQGLQGPPGKPVCRAFQAAIVQCRFLFEPGSYTIAGKSTVKFMRDGVVYATGTLPSGGRNVRLRVVRKLRWRRYTMVIERPGHRAPVRTRVVLR